RELAVIAEYKLATVVHSREQLEMLRVVPNKAALDVLLKLNTGMNRLGFEPNELSAALDELKKNRDIGAITLMTHFANADDALGVGWQLERLERAAGGYALPRSLANSAAVLRYPETHADWIRPGIMLYACSPFSDRVGAELDLTPAMTLPS